MRRGALVLGYLFLYDVFDSDSIPLFEVQRIKLIFRSKLDEEFPQIAFRLPKASRFDFHLCSSHRECWGGKPIINQIAFVGWGGGEVTCGCRLLFLPIFDDIIPCQVEPHAIECR